jgi:ATP-dependent Clp protease adaptor protein ClpS
MTNVKNSDEWSDDEINDGDDDAGNTAVETAKPKLKKPRMYRVIINNDDYTPMEFVVHVLENFFSMDRAKATRVMMDVHNSGKGICGLFTRDTAETKTLEVNNYSKKHNHPLMCSMEVE